MWLKLQVGEPASATVVCSILILRTSLRALPPNAGVLLAR